MRSSQQLCSVTATLQALPVLSADEAVVAAVAVVIIESARGESTGEGCNMVKGADRLRNM